MPQVIPAIKTMVAIHEAIVRDQGAAFRQIEKYVLPTISDAYKGPDEGFRGHLGASIIGDKCGRAIWYNFRWATKPKFTGQELRLFNRGHLEEGRFISMLMMVGVNVVQQDESGKQLRMKFAHGHGGGSVDGVVSNVPDLNCWALLECKTHNDRSFIDLAGENFKDWFAFTCGDSTRPAPFKGKGVHESKPEHYFQMQSYMRKFNLPCALYAAVNKNNDHVWFEIVMFDAALADQLLDRAEKIIWMNEAPKKISESVGDFNCRWCDHKPVCKMGVMVHKNCRTCKFSEPIPNEGQWNCRYYNHIIPEEVQLVGCEQYDKKMM